MGNFNKNLISNYLSQHSLAFALCAAVAAAAEAGKAAEP